MPLGPDERAAFLELMPALGDDVDPAPIQRFAMAHRAALVDELGAVPGVSRIRAAVLRLVPHLFPERADWSEPLAAAGGALMQPPSAHPVSRLSRHPAWIGLAALELAALQGGWEDPVGRAVELSSRAFLAATGGDDTEIGPGEVLWAMAEEATGVGWSSRAHLLLEAALSAEFASPVRQAEARIVAAMNRLQRGEPAAELLVELPDDPDVDARSRTHAAWILAQVSRTRGEEAQARSWLRKAAETVDRASDAEVARRIDAALQQTATLPG